MNGRQTPRIFSATLLFAVAAIASACGSTTPSTPSPVPPPAAQYPSVLGNWAESGSSVVMQYRDMGTQLRFTCTAMLNVQAQNGGTFSGTAEVQGSTSESDKQCTFFSSFSAEMTTSGTVTSVRAERPFRTSECTPVGEPRFSGTASSTSIRIVMTDQASCLDPTDPFRQRMKETDRTLTISVTRRPGAAT